MCKHEQGEGQGHGNGATPLVDATVKLLKEFVYEEKNLCQCQCYSSKCHKVRQKEEMKGRDERGGRCRFLYAIICDAMKEKK